MAVRVEHGDCREIMRSLASEGALFDACVTDPPYHLTSIVKRFGAANAAPAKDRDGLYKRASSGFMGKTWDGGDIAANPETWRLVYDLLKPGAHLLAFGGTRTYHRMACAIEDAGFEIRDQMAWMYGSGFPKSHDVSKAIDKAAGAEREVVGVEKVHDIRNGHGRAQGEGLHASGRDGPVYMNRELTAPATDAARQWQGWGTALKPAWEPICVARKPLIGTVAENVLQYGTGAINIDGCRVPFAGASDEQESKLKNRHADFGSGPMTNAVYGKFNKDRDNYDPQGRWPANVIHDGSDEVLEAFAAFGEKGGSPSRFFYCAKASKKDRAGSKHPTVKPIALMRYLCRLVTPPGGTVLDPFAGSGTTLQAAQEEDFHAIGIEREAEYVADIKRRLARSTGADAPLFARAAP